MFLTCIISIIIYIIATLMMYHNLYNYDKNNKIKLIIFGFIITFIITVIICNISSNGLNTNSKHLSIVKRASILLFSPINASISLPYIFNLLNKHKEERISKFQLKRKLIIFCIILIIIAIFEIGYIKDFEIGLLKGAKS